MSDDPEAPDLWSRAEPESPCVKVCVIHPVEGLCVGCLRTLDEIAGWGAMDAAARHALLEALPARAPRLRKRRGGHAGRQGRREAG